MERDPLKVPCKDSIKNSINLSPNQPRFYAINATDGKKNNPRLYDLLSKQPALKLKSAELVPCKAFTDIEASF